MAALRLVIPSFRWVLARCVFAVLHDTNSSHPIARAGELRGQQCEDLVLPVGERFDLLRCPIALFATVRQCLEDGSETSGRDHHLYMGVDAEITEEWPPCLDVGDHGRRGLSV